MPSTTLTTGVSVTIQAPNPRVVMSPPQSAVTVAPVRGPAGPPGQAGTDPDLPDLSLLFENGLI